MSSRAIASVSINFALLNIPVKVFLAASSQSFSFNMISPKGNRVRYKCVDAVTNEEISKEETSKGYEIEKDKYVVLTDEELDSIVDKNDALQIREFIPEGQANNLLFEKFYWLVPQKGCDRVYRLFSSVLEKTKKVAVATWVTRGKDNLVIIRNNGNHIQMAQAFYANEVRSCEYNFSSGTEPSAQEIELAQNLVNKFSNKKFDHSRYTDRYAEKIRALIESKQSGQSVVLQERAANVMGLLDSLRASLNADDLTNAIEGHGKT